MKKFLLLIIGLISFLSLSKAQKRIPFVFLDEKINFLDIVQQNVLPIKWYDDFVQYEPYNGKPANLKTYVSVFFTQKYLYVVAKCFYNDSLKPYNILTQRDDFGQADYFGFYIDPYNTGLTAYGFFLTVKGVQIDIKLDNQRRDFSWDAAWYSKTLMSDSVIFYYFQIPLSVFRFPSKNSTWRINFFRNIQQIRELDVWNYVDNSKNGIINQTGYIIGIKNIKYSNTLVLLPHFTSMMQKYSNSPQTAKSFIGGLDLKYNLSKNFSLNMILIPDFGELTSDDKILNLTPYEILYPEKRYFFTEEMEIFNKGNIFYTRRIGKTPDLYNKIENMLYKNEVIIRNPSQAQIINATKIAGKTNKGIGIGVLNASTAPTYATILDTILNKTRTILTQDFVNYNVMALNIPLPYNSYISFTNTNMAVPGNKYFSNVSAFETIARNKQNSMAAFVRYNISQIYNDTLVPVLGHLLYTALTKTSGNLRFSFKNQVISDTYNPNDLGYLKQNNIVKYSFSLSYNRYKPFWKLRNWKSTISIIQNRLYQDAKYINTIINVRSSATTLKNNTWGMNFSLSPDPTYDYFEPRVKDKFFLKPPEQSLSIYLSTNYAKPAAIDIITGGYFTSLDKNSQAGGWYTIVPRLRLANNILIVYKHTYHFDFNNFGFVKKKENSDTVFFGQRDIFTQENTITLSYVFTNTLSLNLKVRHYWTIVDYYKYFYLLNSGKLYQVPYSYRYLKNNDLNFNIFNVDIVFRWQFAPGSEVSLTMKKAINTASQNLIFDYYDNFEQMYFHNPHLNNVSLKITYYFDYKTLSCAEKIF